MVIQRWQSLLLLFAIIAMCIFSFCSLGEIQGATQTVSIFSYGIYNVPQDTLAVGTIYVTVVALLSAVLCLFGIFMFKNTRLQKRICMLSIVLVIAAVCSDYLAANSFELAGADSVHYSSMFFIAPAVALLALIGAWRCIRSDEKKLADSDRLWS
ncbi:MAG: DUF4293 domain-containing protein [Muribaculaceae bacterium]|nr:DUF4293 domain-containing protein [Muribaculaceae bacterium]